MITLHFHLQPQYKYELFHINFTVLTKFCVFWNDGDYFFVYLEVNTSITYLAESAYEMKNN